MAKTLTKKGYVDRVTVRQAVKKVVYARNCQLTVLGDLPLGIATGRRDGPYSLGDKVFVWMKNESKKKAEGIWVREKVLLQEGVQVHKSVLRVNQSKVRRDHNP